MAFKQVLGIICVILGVKFYQLLQTPPMPELDPNPYWGPGQPKKDDQSIRPFSIKVSDQSIKDLKTRLDLPPRLTPSLEGSNFTYGVTNEVIEEFVNYWSKTYDWRAREKRLNSVPHFKTTIEGIDIHFIHVKPKASKGVKVVPLLMIHGWPGSFVEFMDIIPILTNPRKGSNVVFELIIPSLPGYGFSQGASKMGLAAPQTAQIFVKLLERLGYTKFYVQGGDWGSLVATHMATLFPENIIGVHVNMAAGVPLIGWIKLTLGSFLPTGLVIDGPDADKLYPLSGFFSKMLRESGYMHIQATKPDTIGQSLNSSPVALMTYIIEKFSSWTDDANTHHPNGKLLEPSFPFTRDALLDNICVYWFSKSITTSQRYYAENFNPKIVALNLDSIPTSVPAGMAAFKNELFNLPRAILKYKFTNLISFRDFESGGHFPAMEVPSLLADHVFEFINIVEQNQNKRTNENSKEL